MPSSRPSRKSAPPAEPALQFRARILHRGEIAFGPGKAELLAAIQSHGSIAQAAAAMGMSYMRAWTLVKTMNASFRAPLVELDRGGLGGGSAKITATGTKVLALYNAIIARSKTSARAPWTQVRDLLKSP